MGLDRTQTGMTLTDSSGSPGSGTQFINSWWQAVLNAFDNEVRCSAYHNTTQSLTDSTWTALSLNSEDYDVGSMHSTTVNTSRVTIPTNHGGLYDLNAQVCFALSGTGLRGVSFYKNGTAISMTQGPSTTASLLVLHAVAKATLVAGDYIEVYAYQSSGGALNSGNATRSLANVLQVTKIR